MVRPKTVCIGGIGTPIPGRAADAGSLAEARAAPRGQGARPGDAGQDGHCRAMIDHRAGKRAPPQQGSN